MATPQMQRSVPEVLQDIVGNLQEIVRSEFRLAKTELKEEASRAAKPVATFGMGLVLASMESVSCFWHLSMGCLS